MELHFEITFLLIFLPTFICFASGKSCLDGSNFGTVFEPYNKFHIKDKSNDAYPLKELMSMLEIISESKFSRISSYGNSKNQAGGTIPMASALVNKKHNKLKISENVAIYQSSDEGMNQELESILEAASAANEIFNGTVTGLIMTSDYTDTPDELGHLSVILQRVSPRVVNNSLKLGVRASNCDHLASKAASNDTFIIMNILKYLGFIICTKMPIAKISPEISANEVAKYLVEIIDNFKKAKLSLKVIGQTGWPSEGLSREGVEGSIQDMKLFWCHLDELSKEKNLSIDLFTAFDEPWKRTDPVFSAITGESHFGWWMRIGNESSGPDDFIEKIYYKEPGKSYTFEILIGLFGSLGVIALIGSIAFLFVKLKMVQSQLLTKADISEFEKGFKGEGSNNGNLTEDALRLPYDRSYEIPKSKFQIDTATLLGKGAFGTVYKGKLEGNDGDVAFKMTQSNSTSSSLKSLLSEIKIMIHVGKHPNVVSIIGAYTGEMKQGKIFIATELCEGGSLESYLRSKKKIIMNSPPSDNYENNLRSEMEQRYANNPMPSREPIPNDNNISSLLSKLIKWSYEIANGMEHIASRNIIHSDLATRNILLSADGTAKITDFGLSRRLYEYTNYVKQNQEPLPWRWMSIESLQHMTFSTKSDVWSFGVTLFELYSLGEVPYGGQSWTIEFTRVLENGLRLYKPEYSSDAIYEIMSQCWNQNPDNRPSFTNLKESFLQQAPYTIL